MAVTVKKITLWRKEVAHEAGALAGVLEPLAQAGSNLRLVMGYTIPGESSRAAIEVYPAGTLTQLGLPNKAYKKGGQSQPRKEIVESIRSFFADGTDFSPCLADADQLDAVLCLVAGMDFICGRCQAPDDPALAKKEGWIWVREINS